MKPQLQLLTEAERLALDIFADFIANKRHGDDAVAVAQDTLSHAMLRIFDRGYVDDLQEPIEMWAETLSGATLATAHKIHDDQVIRGVFIPLEKLEPQP